MTLRAFGKEVDVDMIQVDTNNIHVVLPQDGGKDVVITLCLQDWGNGDVGLEIDNSTGDNYAYDIK